MKLFNAMQEIFHGGRKMFNFELPTVIASVNSRLPQLPPTLVFVSMLNFALNRNLQQESLNPLIGKIVDLQVLDVGLSLRVMLTHKGFQTVSSTSPADCTLSGKARDFVALGLRRTEAESLLDDQRLVLEGDSTLWLSLKDVLAAVEWPSFESFVLSPFEMAAKIRARFVR